MFDSIISGGLNIKGVAICLAVSLTVGILIAVTYSIKSRYTKNFLTTLVLLPIIVQIVIMMVNGNIGTGVAVLGAFSLVRFRSIAGNSKEICCIFFAMAAGIATGIGQIYVALLFVGVVCIVFIAIKFIPIGKKMQLLERELKITVPEDLDYEKDLGAILKKHTSLAQITKVKTSKMGSLFVVVYYIKLRKIGIEKSMIDDLRIINSNLPIVCNSRLNETDGL